MNELRALLEISDAFDTPLLALIGWFLWRVYNNHFPHVEQWLQSIDTRLSRLEGVKEGVEMERRR